MFKKIIDKIADCTEFMCDRLDVINTKLTNHVSDVTQFQRTMLDRVKKINQLSETVKVQNDIIESLLFHGGVSNEVELFVYKTYRNGAKIYLDGKEVDTERATDITVWMTPGEHIRVEVDNG